MKLLPTIKKLKDIKKLENLGVNIDFEPEEEDTAPDFDNEEDTKQVCNDYDNGNMAAWFCAHVTVTYRDLSGDDYLGGCSYNSFKEFTTLEGEYYQDMINSCIREINRQIESINYGVQRCWNIRKAKNLIKPYDLHIVSSKILQTV